MTDKQHQYGMQHEPYRYKISTANSEDYNQQIQKQNDTVQLCYQVVGQTAQNIVYDNTTATGTIIGTIDPVYTQMVFEYDLAFSTGLTIVTANGTAADITVIYKQGITYACHVISTVQS